MKVLVIGANGYIGKHVVKGLLDRGHNVIAMDINNSGIDERAEVMLLSIFDNIEKVCLVAKNVDVCLHMAWRNGFVHNDNSHIEELWSHYNLLSQMMESGLKKLAVMGTMHEVGYWEGAIDENSPCNPSSKYGIAKNALRQLVFSKAKETNTIIQWLRCYYITGDDKKSNSIFAKLMTAEEKGMKTFPFTSGRNKYDFIDVDELSYQIARVIEQNEVVDIINCCTGQPISLAEKVESFINENGLRISLEYGKYPDRPYDSPGVWGDANKINSIILSGRDKR